MRYEAFVACMLWLSVAAHLWRGGGDLQTAVIAGCAGLVSGMFYANWCARKRGL